MIEQSKQCVVYFLIDPRDGQVKYVGSSSNGANRFRVHVKDPNKETNLKAQWVRSLMEAGLEPIYCIAEFTDKDNRFVREQWWIRQFWNQGIVLLNQRLPRLRKVDEITDQELAKAMENLYVPGF